MGPRLGQSTECLGEYFRHELKEEPRLLRAITWKTRQGDSCQPVHMIWNGCSIHTVHWPSLSPSVTL